MSKAPRAKGAAREGHRAMLDEQDAPQFCRRATPLARVLRKLSRSIGEVGKVYDFGCPCELIAID